MVGEGAQGRDGARRADAAAPLLHVGYHKTGTTWLQTFLFNDARAGFSQPWARGDIVERIVLANSFRYDPAAVRAYFEPGIERERAAGRIPVISAERLSGNPHSGGYDGCHLAHRLRETFGGARVLVVVREQRSMILSLYRQFVRVGGCVSLRRYLHPPASGIARVPFFRFDYLEYDLMVGRLQSLFGAASVLVLPFELLQRDPGGFVRRIVEFSGGREVPPPERDRLNVGMSGVTLSFKRRFNRVLVRDTLNPAAWFDSPDLNRRVELAFDAVDRLVPGSLRRWSDGPLRRTIEEVVGERYRESNGRTGRLAGLDLAGFGYPVAD